MIYQAVLQIYEINNDMFTPVTTIDKQLSNFDRQSAALFLRKSYYGMIQNKYFLVVTIDTDIYIFYGVFIWKVSVFAKQPNLSETLTWLRENATRIYLHK